MSGFETRWLDLREPADHAARDAVLLRKTIEHVDAGGEHIAVVDLGCGTGSTVRAFSTAAARWHWRLLDNDPLLLSEAAKRHGGEMQLECLKTDLGTLSPDLFKQARLVTASALLDLVSTGFLQSLVSSLEHAGCSFYTALNYDGHCTWHQAHKADASIVNAFNFHQRRDKGFGPALGPAAEDVLREMLQTAGFHVLKAQSSWQLGADEAELQRQFVMGVATAAAETGLLETGIIEEWRAYRLDHTDSGCMVGHWDMLGLR